MSGVRGQSRVDGTAGRLGSLGSRVGLVLVAVLSVALTLLAAWWVRETRRAIHEEVQAATHVAQQWLVVLVAETLRDPGGGPDRLMAHLRAVGRLRANQLEILGADGAALYVSPPPTYKAGRFAPAWFSRGVTPSLPERRFDAGDRRIVLRPDPSRAVLDAWDDLCAGLGGLLAAVIAIVATVTASIRRALSPLAQIDHVLACGAEGRFDRRLPEYPVAELDRVAKSYNRLADALQVSREQNLRLEEDQAFAAALQTRLEDERRVISRELHDEFGQGITAVRAIAGAILQRSAELPHIYGSAQAILAMTGQMQDGVRAILQRLRPACGSGARIDRAVAEYCRLWSAVHPTIELACSVSPVAQADGGTGMAVLRLLQESLTNVARHSGASRVSVRLQPAACAAELEVRDNGRGLAAEIVPGHGLAGMRERVAELGGEFRLSASPGGGLRVSARIPLAPMHVVSAHGCHA